MTQENETVDLGFEAAAAEIGENAAKLDEVLKPEPEKPAEEPKLEPEKPAEDPPIKFKDEVRSTSWQEFEAAVLKAREVPEKVIIPPAPTERQAERTRLEQEAGRRRIAVNEAQLAYRNPGTAVPDARELAAQPTTTPVFRPNDFDEYKTTFKSPAQTVSKDKR